MFTVTSAKAVCGYDAKEQINSEIYIFIILSLCLLILRKKLCIKINVSFPLKNFFDCIFQVIKEVIILKAKGYNYCVSFFFQDDFIPCSNTYWSQKKVVEFCSMNYIMYILRGLPGSGKSGVAEKIKSLYKDGNVVVCSADNFR